jgi:hypothetical protein
MSDQQLDMQREEIRARSRAQREQNGAAVEARAQAFNARLAARRRAEDSDGDEP